MALRILLAAEESAGIQVLRRLLAGDDELVGVLSSADGADRGATVAGVARQAGANVLPAARDKDPDFAEWVEAQGIDLLINVHSLFLIDPAVVTAPRIGSFNLHPGPLPEYAGLDAPSWAIYNREPEHGVTLHWIDAEIDTGAIAYEERFPIDEAETGLSLSAKCVRLGVPLVDRLVADAQGGATEIPAAAQDRARRRYFSRRAPQGGWLLWDRPAGEIDAFVRAADFTPFASPWGHPRTTRDGTELRVVKVRLTGEPTTHEPGTVGRTEGDAVLVASADEWVLLERVRDAAAMQRPAAVIPSGARLTVPPEALAG